jgi:hypothetical protein
MPRYVFNKFSVVFQVRTTRLTYHVLTTNSLHASNGIHAADKFVHDAFRRQAAAAAAAAGA